jgi:hypothetical protein
LLQDYTLKTEIKTGFVCKCTISDKYSKKKIFTVREEVLRFFGSAVLELRREIRRDRSRPVPTEIAWSGMASEWLISITVGKTHGYRGYQETPTETKEEASKPPLHILTQKKF